MKVIVLAPGKKNPEFQRQMHLYFYMTSLKNIQQNKQKTCAHTYKAVSIHKNRFLLK